MNLRLPWLNSRIYLLIFSLFDSIIYFFSYNFYFQTKYENSFLISFGVIIHLIISYTCGRYIVERRLNKFNILKVLINRSFVFILVFILLISILRGFTIFQDIYYEFIKFIILNVLISSIFIYFSQIIIFREQSKTKRWLYLGLKEDFFLLSNFIKNTTSLIELDYLDKNFNQEIEKNIQEFYSGLIIGNLSNLNEEEKSCICEYKYRGLNIITNLHFSIDELQSIPSFILNNDEILRDSFFVDINSIGMRIKRLGDFILSIILLIVTAPILIISVILIKLEDFGPVFYSQIRNGYKGIPFTIWKLRTMRVNSESNGAEWAKRSDPRITKIGFFLRKMRIDELPQLVAVITGKMSLIGPRPERPEFDSILEKEIKNYKLRYLLKPGLSGWSQVNYPYGASVKDSSMKLSFDLYYLQNFSNLLDILILFKTIKLVFNLKGSSPKNIK